MVKTQKTVLSVIEKAVCSSGSCYDCDPLPAHLSQHASMDDHSLLAAMDFESLSLLGMRLKIDSRVHHARPASHMDERRAGKEKGEMTVPSESIGRFPLGSSLEPLMESVIEI